MGVSVFLADDHPLIRLGLRIVLGAVPELVVVGEAGDGLATVRLVERLRPDVLVLDLVMPGLGGLDALPIVRTRSPRTRVVALAEHASEDFVHRAVAGGALAYVLKSCDPAHAAEAVRRAATGQPYLCPGISERAFDASGERPEPARADPHDLLTPRERQVLQLAAEGHTSAAVAARLSISTRTAESHRASVRRKLGLKTQADLVRYAIRRGMLPPEG